VTALTRGIDAKPFRCDVARDGADLRVTLEGELDIATSPQLEAVLREPCDDGVTRRVLDLARLTFMDSSGLRVILSAHSVARREGPSLVLVPGPPAIQRVFEITGMKDELRFVGP
jgi:anti-anti-sigma factor